MQAFGQIVDPNLTYEGLKDLTSKLKRPAKIYRQLRRHALTRQCGDLRLVRPIMDSHRAFAASFKTGCVVISNEREGFTSYVPLVRHFVRVSEAAQLNHTVRDYLVELVQQNPTDEPLHEQTLVSGNGLFFLWILSRDRI